MRHITHIVVHSSATSPKVRVNAAVITRWHRERGWLDIGYHFVITRNGNVETGRPLERAGAHVQGMNATTIGICLAGGVNEAGEPEDNFTLEQKHALAKLIYVLRCQFKDAAVVGHRDIAAKPTACPSFDVQKWWQDTVENPQFDAP